MSSINKTSVLSQFSSALSALNVPTETSEDLLLYLKSAINAEVSAATIISELTSRIEAIADSSTLQNLLILTAATSLITDDRSMTISDLSTLAGVTNAAAGTVVFVDDANIPYIRKSNGNWVPIDPSLQNPALPNGYAWGYNTYGQVGDNTIDAKSSPVSVVGGFADWIDIQANFEHNLGLQANGTAWGWGGNNFGQLGDGTTTNRSYPVSVGGGFNDWAQLSAGGGHSLGIRTNGTAWAWGYNSNGELGDGTIDNRSSPVAVVGGFTWTQLSAGIFHSLGIRSNGTAWSWGKNYYGQLGTNNKTSRSSPVAVVGGFTDWSQLSAGNTHSLGIRANGTAWAWGGGGNGELGTNTYMISAISPVAVVGGFTDWVQLSAGSNSNCIGVRANGTAWGWGANGQGQIGNGATTYISSPAAVVGGFTDWVKVSAGTNHTMGLRANGTAWSWGYNGPLYAPQGKLGDGTAAAKSSPVSVIGGFADWIGVGAGGKHSVGVRGR